MARKKRQRSRKKVTKQTKEGKIYRLIFLNL